LDNARGYGLIEPRGDGLIGQRQGLWIDWTMAGAGARDCLDNARGYAMDCSFGVHGVARMMRRRMGKRRKARSCFVLLQFFICP